MTSTMLSPNYMIKSFPRNPLPAVREDVTYPDIIELLKSIKENYKSVDSLWGGGENGLLGGASTNTWYDKIAPGIPFWLLKNPGI